MGTETELRDQLAVERTHLANERTLLAYVRTALAMIAAGAGLIHFVGTPASYAIGWILIVFGAAAFPLGFWRFRRVRTALAAEANGPHVT
jgi:putative membrane protein